MSTHTPTHTCRPLDLWFPGNNYKSIRDLFVIVCLFRRRAEQLHAAFCAELGTNADIQRLVRFISNFKSSCYQTHLGLAHLLDFIILWVTLKPVVNVYNFYRFRHVLWLLFGQRGLL